ncbi:hypothetical protein GO013_00460 [Pseudodesulfovibrio sp. JC047]|uniref:hypothetical protein n=1 Tax=Pseudodesulfovibrio sp. JC047 TaxID=2683199 RepID=UPI0013D4E93A|nr:hypothetical protein [Pseudodesulfovibrio sp. JC047]NDV17889.1 hypothetical protein [Pseudodesulfovibrio sp. JC047]
MTKNFINEQYNVEDPSASKGFAPGEKRGDYADAWRETGRVVLVGLAGSGKRELARLLAERTGLDVVMPKNGAEAVAVLTGPASVVVLDDVLVEEAEVQSSVHDAGKVFYLMADSRVLSERVATRDGNDDTEALWRLFSARLTVMEPIFYSVLHFILQGSQPVETLVDDAVKKIRY